MITFLHLLMPTVPAFPALLSTYQRTIRSKAWFKPGRHFCSSPKTLNGIEYSVTAQMYRHSPLFPLSRGALTPVKIIFPIDIDNNNICCHSSGMYRLEQFATTDPQWTLEQLVEVANHLLPSFLPDLEVNQKIQEEVNPRLVRHYTTIRLIERPIKEGRMVRYTYRHLLQLLVVRRLLMQGYSATSMQKMTLAKSNLELELLLQEGVTFSVQASNPAMDFLQQIQQQSVVPITAPPIPPSPPVPTSSPPQWMRLTILPGLELHVREDFDYPKGTGEQKNLLQLIHRALQSLDQHKRTK